MSYAALPDLSETQSMSRFSKTVTAFSGSTKSMHKMWPGLPAGMRPAACASAQRAPAWSTRTWTPWTTRVSTLSTTARWSSACVMRRCRLPAAGAGRPGASCFCSAATSYCWVVLTAAEQPSHMVLPIASSRGSYNALPLTPDMLLYLHRSAGLPSRLVPHVEVVAPWQLPLSPGLPGKAWSAQTQSAACKAMDQTSADFALCSRGGVLRACMFLTICCSCRYSAQDDELAVEKVMGKPSLLYSVNMQVSCA